MGSISSLLPIPFISYMAPESLYLGRQAAVSLKIVIVGGGLSGLAAGFALSKAGHSCIVLERANVIGQHHGVCQLPSNLTKIFEQWGIATEELDATACKPLGLEFLMYRTGVKIGGLDWKELVFNATGSDWYIADQADVHNMLFRLAQEAGVDVRLGCNVKSVDAYTPSVTLDSGEVVRGDMVVGADGDQSFVRDVVLDYHDPGVPRGTAMYITSIPTERMVHDPELKALVDTPRGNEWMGPSRIMLAIPIKQKGLYIIYLIHQDTDPTVSEDWTTHDCVEQLQKEVEGWEPRVQKLMKLVDYTCDIKQVRREPLDTWVHESGQVVLVGDSCHPMPAYGLHKASMAIEDAAVLGNLFSRLQSRDNITFLLHAYQELRQTRCTYVQSREDVSHLCYPLREGTPEDLEQRDEELREAYLSKDITPEQFEELWENSTEIFRYEVELEAEGWWADFGRLMLPEQQDRRGSTFMNLGVTRTTVVESLESAPSWNVMDSQVVLS